MLLAQQDESLGTGVIPTMGINGVTEGTLQVCSYHRDLWREWPKTRRLLNYGCAKVGLSIVPISGTIQYSPAGSCHLRMRKTIPIPTRLFRTVHRSLCNGEQVVQLLAIERVHH